MRNQKELTKEQKIEGAKMLVARSAVWQKSDLPTEFRDKFRLIGLSKPLSMTCTPLENEEIFWPKVALTKAKFNELWKYCHGNWDEPKFAIIAHCGLNKDGTPINGVVISVEVE